MTLYSTTILAGEVSSFPNQCMTGYIKNLGSTTTTKIIILSEGMATLKKSIAPLQSFNFTNLYIDKISNLSTTNNIEASFSDSANFSVSENPYAFSQVGSFEVVALGVTDINIEKISSTAVFNVTGAVAITGNVSVTATGTVNIGNTVNIAGAVSISAGTVNIGNTVTITGAVGINAGTVDINGTVNVSLTEITTSTALYTDIQKYLNTNNGTTFTLSTTAVTELPSSTVQHFQVRNGSSTEILYVGSKTAMSILLFPNSMFLWDSNPNETTQLNSWYVQGSNGKKVILTWQV